MSEEEKKAIKYLEFLSNERCECEVCQNAKKQYKTILNLIEKQQKEIESLKTKYKELNALTTSCLDTLKKCVHKDTIREKIKELEEDLKKETDYEIEGCIDTLKELLGED